MRLSILVAGCVLASSVATAQAARSFPPGNYAFLPRTAAYDPQFDAWHVQVVADSFRVIDPSGALFLVSVTKMSGDTVLWTDIQGPCTGVVSRYIVGRDSVGLKLDLIDDACTDRAAAVPNIYFAPAKRSGDSSALERPRKYERLVAFRNG
ncbi:MAG: hypothetical protein ACT4P6_18710 [Gemmatimonadaceae bacterium]